MPPRLDGGAARWAPSPGCSARSAGPKEATGGTVREARPACLSGRAAPNRHGPTRFPTTASPRQPVRPRPAPAGRQHARGLHRAGKLRLCGGRPRAARGIPCGERQHGQRRLARHHQGGAEGARHQRFPRRRPAHVHRQHEQHGARALQGDPEVLRQGAK